MGRPRKIIVLAGGEADCESFDRCRFVLETRGYRVFTAFTENVLTDRLLEQAVDVVVSWASGIAEQTKAISPETRVLEMGSRGDTGAEAVCAHGPFGSRWLELIDALALRKRGPKPSAEALAATARALSGRSA